MAKANLQHLAQIEKINQLQKEYQTAIPRRQNQIIQEIAEDFKKKVLSEVYKESVLIEEECLSALYLQIWKSLEDYNPDNKFGATFFTHLYGRLKWVAPRSRTKVNNCKWNETTVSLDKVWDEYDD